MDRMMMKGNEAIAEAAILAGCRFFFGYPITPQNEIPEYMSRRMPQVDGCFIQAESEVSAINMVYGAAASGARVMTSSSSPGISLKQEGISYIAGSELPCVIVNIVRGGPGLGGIQAAQSDYFQAVKGGGHGDYRLIVLAPASVNEAVTLTQEAFDLADLYRMPTMILGDGMLGQMMEPVTLAPIPKRELPKKDWAADGNDGSRERNIINSLLIDPPILEEANLRMQKRYAHIAENETRYECERMEDAELVVVAYGTMARIARSAMRVLREEGKKVGLLRPITLWPFPTKALADVAARPGTKALLTVELSQGQLVEDVRLAVNGAKPVRFYGRSGGMVPTVREVANAMRGALEEV